MATPISDRFNPAKLYKMAQVKAASDSTSPTGASPNGEGGAFAPTHTTAGSGESAADTRSDSEEKAKPEAKTEAIPNATQAIVTESDETVPDQFSVRLPIKQFSRLWQLVGDYRLVEGVDDERASEQGQQQDADTADENVGIFEASFRLSKFADSSFVADLVAVAGTESGSGRSATPSGEGDLPANKSSGRGLERKNASSRASDKRQNSKAAVKGGSLSSVSRGVRGDANERAATTPIIVATGDLKALLNLQCQRCLDTYVEKIETEFRFAFAANEITADVLPETMDPVMLDEEGLISVVDMFEDELLLRLPTHAMHADESQCSEKAVPYQAHVVTEEQLANEIKPDNPFAVLKNIDLPKGEN